MIKLSVIITTYNSEKTIQRLLDSILGQEDLNQTFSIELIIIDDCSTDKTVAILKGNNLDFISTEVNSKGPNKGRNIGLKIATGDYFCIVDHDDEWKLDRIKKTIPYFNKYSIISSGYTILNSKRNTEELIISKENNNLDYVYFEKNETFKNILSRNGKGQIVYLGSLFLEKSLLKIEFEEVFGLVDFDWVLSILNNRDSVEIKDSLYLRHVVGDNLSFNGHFRHSDFYYSLMTIEKYLAEYPEIVKQSYKKIYENRARFYYLNNEMSKARFHFHRSKISKKTIVLYITTFFGSNYIKKRYSILG
jgi:glycosyltransferase involved in cell wall biosynthesis